VSIVLLFLNLSYSVEEIRFNLLAIGQRLLPALQSQLDEFEKLTTTLESHLNDVIPDWKVLAEYVPAAGPVVDSDAIVKAAKEDDMQGLLSLKKKLERDIAILKGKVTSEEETISDYTVRQKLAD
jgi:hypothetical protein